MDNRVSIIVNTGKSLHICVWLTLTFIFLTACSNEGSVQENVAEEVKDDSEELETRDAEHDPVTITIGVRYLHGEEIQRYIVEPVAEKYPWITVETMGLDFDALQELLLADEMPDILITNNINGMPPFEESGLFTSIEDLIEKHDMDLSRFEPETLDAVRLSSDKDYLVGLPYTRQFMSLYYNKEIFDLFGVPYPEDGLTWDEVTELAIELTRESNGVQYRGLEPNVSERLAAQLSLPFVDPETKQSAVTSEGWRKVFRQLETIYTIPGNEQIALKGVGNAEFTGDQSLAMFVAVNETHEDGFIDNVDMWDIAQVPVWEEAPTVGGGIDEHIMLLSATSEHRDDAFRVMSTVVSDEVQMDMSTQGKLSVLANPEIQEVFGGDTFVWEGKNIDSIFKTTPAPPYQLHYMIEKV